MLEFEHLYLRDLFDVKIYIATFQKLNVIGKTSFLNPVILWKFSNYWIKEKNGGIMQVKQQ